MDPETIAMATSLLVARKGAEALGSELGTRTGKLVGQVVDALRGRFGDDRRAHEALIAVERSPEDSASLERLRWVVEGYAQRDAEFRSTLDLLLARAQDETRPGQLVINANTVKSVFQNAVTVHGDLTIG